VNGDLSPSEGRSYDHNFLSNRMEQPVTVVLNEDPKVAKAAWSSKKSNYGITEAVFRAMLAEQGGGCAICGVDPDPEPWSLCVDHDHQTGEIRGILCMGCNAGISALGENAATLRRAAEYILKAPPGIRIRTLRR
jgi:hypothetical protein